MRIRWFLVLFILMSGCTRHATLSNETVLDIQNSHYWEHPSSQTPEVVVLPFLNKNTTQDWLVWGIQEGLTSYLDLFMQARCLSRAELSRFLVSKETLLPVTEVEQARRICREFKAKWVVWGHFLAEKNSFNQFTRVDACLEERQPFQNFESAPYNLHAFRHWFQLAQAIVKDTRLPVSEHFVKQPASDIHFISKQWSAFQNYVFGRSSTYTFDATQYSVAEVWFQEAIRMDHRFSQAHLALGELYGRWGLEVKQSDQYYHHYYHRSGDEIELALKGNFPLGKHDIWRARRFIEADIAYINGLEKYQQGQYQPAQTLFLSGFEQTPEDPYMAYYLGETLIQLGASNEGVHYVRWALELQPDFALARQRLDKINKGDK